MVWPELEEGSLLSSSHTHFQLYEYGLKDRIFFYFLVEKISSGSLCKVSKI